MRTVLPCFAALVLAAASCQAHAAILIRRSNGEPVPASAASLTFNFETGGWDITLQELYAPWSDSVFNIIANGGETIDNIFIDIDGPPAGSPVIVRAYGEGPGHLRAVHNILQRGTAETLLNRVQTLEDIGSVQVEAIGQLIAGRDLLGPVIATTGDNPVRGITDAIAARHILGDIRAENGRVGLVRAREGNIGSTSQPVQIIAKHNVLHVDGRHVHALIHTRFNGGTGGLYALIAEQFHGSVIAESLIHNPWNGIQGRVKISQRFEGLIALGKSFTNPEQFIEMPSQGLAGQIIINADNAAGGSWTSPVRVGQGGDPNQIVINSPSYASSPAQLGGGAIGLVPFRLHNQACSPANGATVQLAATAPPLTVQLRHYGPVTWNGAIPLIIESRPANSSQAFVSMPMTDFVASRSNADPNAVTITAAPGRPGFERGFEYRLQPSPQLKCEVDAAPAVQWLQPYTFSVVSPPCVGDINSDGVVNVNDLLFVIAFWGPVQPAFPAPDINSDGVVNVNDLLLVISRWGACQ
jgi:hypothetical protein